MKIVSASTPSEILQALELLATTPLESRAKHVSLLNLCTNLDDMRDPAFLQKVIPYLERALEGETGLHEVELKIKLARIHMNLSQHNCAREIIHPLVKKHFGMLPTIAAMLTNCSEELTLDLHPLVESTIRSGNYSFSIDPYLEYYAPVLSRLAMELFPGDNPNQRYYELADKIRKILKQNVPKNDALNLADGMIAMCQKDYRLALQKFHAMQEETTMTKPGGPALYYKLHCYIRLGDKTRANKSFQKFKRFMPDHPENDAVAKVIEVMEDHGKTPVSIDALRVCGNPLCGKKEIKKRQFQVCDGCKKVVYCSRKCQKQHWKAGHKAYCN